MKKVLIISYYFPPDPTIGSLRIKGLAKYLPEFGWEPIILTKNLPDDPSLNLKIIKTPYDKHDCIDTLRKRIGISSEVGIQDKLGIAKSNENKITRIICDFFSAFGEIVSYPDPRKGWFKYALKYGWSEDELNSELKPAFR